MDKNKIHIDEFVRNVLADREEDRPVGAWTNMRQLLDSTLPVAETVGTVTNWRRIFGAASILLAILTLSITGYQVSQSFQEETPLVSENNLDEHASGSKTTFKADENVKPNAEAAAPSSSSTNPNFGASNKKQVSTDEIVTVTSNSAGKQAITHPQPYPKADVQKGAKRLAPLNKSSAENNNKQEKISPSDSRLEKIVLEKAEVSAIAMGGISSGFQASIKMEYDAALSLERAKVNVPLTLYSSAYSEEPNAISSSATKKSSSKATAKAKSAKQLERDTLLVIRTTTTWRDKNGKRLSEPRLDTISTHEKMVREKLTEEKNSGVAASDKTQNMEQGTAKSTAGLPKSFMGPQPDAAYKNYNPSFASSKMSRGVSVKKKTSDENAGYFNAEGLHNAIDRTKSAISQVQFVPGILGGLNATFGGTNFFGFQLGLSGTFVLSQNWSLSMEPRYMQRANRGAAVHDDYLSTRQNGNLWTEDTVNHFFNFSTVQTLEIPFFLRREIGKFFVMAGANFLYAFNINVDEVDQARGKPLTYQGSIGSSSTLQRAGSLEYKDFASRFGIGYTCGIGAQIAPNVQLDVRTTQTFWDNANNSGAKSVSRQLYQNPSVQFTIGYRLGKKDHR